MGSVAGSEETTRLLVLVRGLIASDRSDEARQRLLLGWSSRFDPDFPSTQQSRVALRLFERLGFSTDDEEAWDALPDSLSIYRIGNEEGLSWTTDREVAEHLLVPDKVGVKVRIIQKKDVLAVIT